MSSWNTHVNVKSCQNPNCKRSLAHTGIIHHLVWSPIWISYNLQYVIYTSEPCSLLTCHFGVYPIFRDTHRPDPLTLECNPPGSLCQHTKSSLPAFTKAAGQSWLSKSPSAAAVQRGFGGILPWTRAIKPQRIWMKLMKRL